MATADELLDFQKGYIVGLIGTTTEGLMSGTHGEPTEALLDHANITAYRFILQAEKRILSSGSAFFSVGLDLGVMVCRKEEIEGEEYFYEDGYGKVDADALREIGLQLPKVEIYLTPEGLWDKK